MLQLWSFGVRFDVLADCIASIIGYRLSSCGVLSEGVLLAIGYDCTSTTICT